MPSEGIWPWVREAQLKTLSLKATGMAVTVDIGDSINIHPADKWDVGARLALVARKVAYGENIVYSGPVYHSMKINRNKIRLTFINCGTGLESGVPPWTSSGIIPKKSTELTGFAIAGSERKFVWAKAEIIGDEVVVYSERISNPVAVRFDWADNPKGNLYNKEGLPASPFRTDSWDCSVNNKLRAGYFNEAQNKGNRKFFTAGAWVKMNLCSVDFSYLIPINRDNPLANTSRFNILFDEDSFKK